MSVIKQKTESCASVSRQAEKTLVFTCGSIGIRVSQPNQAMFPLQGDSAQIEVAVRRLMTKKLPHYCAAVLFGIRRRPTLPDRYQSSTIGTEGLNFCVRYGNRWDPFVIATGNGELCYSRTLTTAQLTVLDSVLSDLFLVFLFPIGLKIISEIKPSTY